MDKMKINDAIDRVFQFVKNVNKYLEVTEPWKMVKVDQKKAGSILFTSAESLRIVALLLLPIMPNRAEIVLSTLNSNDRSVEWGKLSVNDKIKTHQPLFPRIDLKI